MLLLDISTVKMCDVGSDAQIEYCIKKKKKYEKISYDAIEVYEGEYNEKKI